MSYLKDSIRIIKKCGFKRVPKASMYSIELKIHEFIHLKEVKLGDPYIVLIQHLENIRGQVNKLIDNKIKQIEDTAKGDI